VTWKFSWETFLAEAIVFLVLLRVGFKPEGRFSPFVWRNSANPNKKPKQALNRNTFPTKSSRNQAWTDQVMR